MPKTLASGHTTVFRYRGNVTPPKDYDQWTALIRKLTAHWVERYGAAEVRKWFFEVWMSRMSRPSGRDRRKTTSGFTAATVAAIKSVDGSLKVGGRNRG
jgi:xylan 1,4-beta-xylosidase